MLKKGSAGLVKECDRLFALYSRKALEEIVQRVAGGQIINQIAHRYPRAGEHRLSTHDFRIDGDELVLHNEKF